MIRSLIISGFAIIDRVECDFSPGLNILTGETGAGKSIIIDALGLLLGERASADYIRAGCESASIDAIFEIADISGVSVLLASLEIPFEDGELILRREITRSGKSKCLVNGRLVNLTFLKELGDFLVDIHGQHEHQNIWQREKHLEYVDGYGGHSGLLEEVGNAHQSVRDAERELAELNQSLSDPETIELLRYQVSEIDRISPKPDEDEDLLERVRKLANSADLARVMADVLTRMTDGTDYQPSIRDQLVDVQSELTKLVKLDSQVCSFNESFDSIIIGIDELIDGLRDYQDGLPLDSSELEEIESRLAALTGLRRKYNGTLGDVLDRREEFARQVSLFDEAGTIRAGIERKLSKALEGYQLAAAKLGEARRKAGQKLARAVSKELHELGMTKAKFSVGFSARSKSGDDRKATFEKGAETAEFMIAPNPDSELMPLRKIASGGEISRVMLALKVSLAEADPVPLLVFDEIDNGIGGRIGSIAGKKLHKTAKGRQVLCITHLPQIAAYADANWSIEKTEKDSRTVTVITRLKNRDIEKEIARMLAGQEPTKTSLAHARELIREAGLP